ncbi:unnamed protein product [Rotaria sp. Silwood2]|nr:unnamed protein product [Rotaria sp. Silwood2]CAF4427850.1 unnamed protein product [Rotaria sp. Silwood2]
MLREMFDSHVGLVLASKPLVHIHTYSRKPSIENIQGDSPYIDLNESLVTIHYNPSVISTDKGIGLRNTEKCLLSDDRVFWTPCPVDAGKGALTLTTTSGLTVVNVHVPYDNKAATLLLSNIPWPENNNPFVCVGDMNRYSDTLMKMIVEVTAGKPASTLLFPVTTDKPTRFGLNQNSTLKKIWIDYFVVSASLKELAICPAIVYDNIGDISDHYPISLQFKAECS